MKKTLCLMFLTLCCGMAVMAQTSDVKEKSGRRLFKKTVKTDTVVNDHFRRLQQVSDLIEQKYVETPDYQRITEKGVTAMLSELDPHSVYIAAKDVQRSNEGLQANFEGVGIAFQIVDDTISVTDVIAGGPCEKVGMMIGDKLLKIDDTLATYKGVNNSFVFNHLRGPRGTKVVLTVHRQGEATPLVFNIVRDKIPLHSIDTYFMRWGTYG